MADSIRDLLEVELQDPWSAETQLLEALPQMQEAASSAALKQAFAEHRQVTAQQVERLEEVCRNLGVDPKGETCNAMEGLVEESEELLDAFDRGPVLDAALIGAAQKVEHYEIAAYGTLTAMLKAMGERRSVELLTQSLVEEKAADDLLTRIAEREVNPAALPA